MVRRRQRPQYVPPPRLLPDTRQYLPGLSTCSHTPRQTATMRHAPSWTCGGQLAGTSPDLEDGDAGADVADEVGVDHVLARALHLVLPLHLITVRLLLLLLLRAAAAAPLQFTGSRDGPWRERISCCSQTIDSRPGLCCCLWPAYRPSDGGRAGRHGEVVGVVGEAGAVRKRRRTRRTRRRWRRRRR